LEVLRPYDEEALSRSSDDLTVLYSASEDPDVLGSRNIDLTLQGPCFETLSRTDLPDLGWYEVGAGTIQGGSECDGELEIIRRGADGYLDPAYEVGGSIEAQQKRQVSLLSEP
jgi:hypothetical protein